MSGGRVDLCRPVLRVKIPEMSLYAATIPQYVKVLKNVDGWLDKAAAHAKSKGYDAEQLLTSRLAPDQYSLLRQIQAACDGAKLTAARLTGKEAPKHPDTEQTVAEIRQRLASCISYLESFEEMAFKGAEDRPVALPFLEGKIVSGRDYVNEMSLPNFYFHVTTAYAILRHNGVDLGKRDFLGSLTVRDA
jgi:uncharacterized protein